MDTINLSLAEQMRLDDIEIARRMELLDFTPADAEALADAKPMIQEELENIVKEFYMRQVAIPEIALIIGDSETMRRLRYAQRTYIADLFAGYYDVEYVNNRLRIGLVHKRIGVKPKYYLSAIKTLIDILRRVLKQTIPDSETFVRTMVALDKLLVLDTVLVFDTYIRSMMIEIEAAKDKALIYARSLEDKVAMRTQELAELSRVDALTGVLNRRAFMEEARLQVARAKRAQTALSLIYIDIDGFKRINDSQGHQGGDKTLRAIGVTMREVLRETDIAGRYGGDEFCIVLPSTDADGAKIFSDRLMAKIAGGTGVSLSIGVATTGPERHVSLDELIQRADKLMYSRKANLRKKKSVLDTPEQTQDTANQPIQILTEKAKSALLDD